MSAAAEIDGARRRSRWPVYVGVALLTLTLFGPLWPVSPFATDLEHMREGPSLAHPFGTDDTGRCVLARLLNGARSTIGTSLVGVAFAAVIGVALGALAGLLRGVVDRIVLQAIEVFVCFPTLLLLLAIGSLFGSSEFAVIAAFAASMWPSFARSVRGELLSLREREYVATARDLGVRGVRLFRGHLWPSLRGQVAVVAAFCTAHAIVAESTLSFLGIGPGVQRGSWGSVLAQGKADAHLFVWHLWVFPGALIVLAVWCCHALADRAQKREA